jgi:hypothetical protein
MQRSNRLRPGAMAALLMLSITALATDSAPVTSTTSPFAKITEYFESGGKGQWQWPDSLDAVIAAPKNHKLLLENDRVRVLQVTVPAHGKEEVHTHRWPSVFVGPTQCKGDARVWDGTGNVLFDSRASKSAWPYQAAVWRAGPEPPHAAESLSDEDCVFYRIEIKQLTTAGTLGKWPVELDGPVAAPKNHKVILENEYVRVQELSGQPHDKEKVHTHPWPSVKIELSSGDFVVHGASSEVVFDSRTLRGGITYPEIRWESPEGPHWVESVDDKPSRGFRIELKQ